MAACTNPEKPAPAPSAAVNRFGPESFGRLKIGMTEQEALATGDLGPSPISVVSGCMDYSFKDGPAPDPSRMAAEAAIEKEADDADKAADAADGLAGKELPKHASARESADHAQLSANAAQANATAAEAAGKSAQNSADRATEFQKSGGVSFGSGKLRLILAPPAAKTATGIERGSTLVSLKKAYEAQGLRSTSESRYEFPVPSQPGWVFAFKIVNEKVAAFLLVNPAILCS